VIVSGSAMVLERVRQLASFIGRRLQYDLQFDELKEGLVFSHRQLECHAFPTRHRLKQSYGFVFQEQPRRRFLPTVAERLGVPAGPERRRLLAGESVRVPTGVIVHPDEVLGPEERGKKLIYVSDTMYFPELSTYAAGADCLIAEATFLSTEAELATEAGHMTAAQAATIARDAGVGVLYLNHLSQRYAHAEHLLLEEARRIFPATHLAYDLHSIAV
jgi:ribonuclease Z